MEYSLSEDGHLVVTEKRRFDENDYVVNIGPNHPSTHGVLRLQTVIDGETVKRIYPHLGYIHRGIEKMWENMTYPQTGIDRPSELSFCDDAPPRSGWCYRGGYGYRTLRPHPLHPHHYG